MENLDQTIIIKLGAISIELTGGQTSILVYWSSSFFLIVIFLILFLVYRQRRLRHLLRRSETLRASSNFRPEGMLTGNEDLSSPDWEPLGETAAIYLERLRLTNIRCFQSLDIRLEDGGDQILRTTILGDNSLGKSTILKAVAIGLCKESDAIALMKAMPGKMIREGSVEGKIELFLKDRRTGEPFRIVQSIKSGENDDEKLIQSTKPGSGFPWGSIFVCGYGTQRTAAATASFDTYSSRDAVATLFDVKATLQNPELVLLRRQDWVRSQLESRILDVLLINGDKGSIDSSLRGLTVEGPWGFPAAFDTLSDGYRSTMQWMLDLFGWLVHAKRLNPYEEPTGILLIDEIEQHLHPRWQRHIMQRLSRQLPNFQIITTSHTPLVASGMADVNSARILRVFSDVETGLIKAESIDPDNLEGMRADQVLTEFFDLVSSRNPGSSDDINRYYSLRAMNSRSIEESNEFNALKERFDSVLEFGESEVERKVERAVLTALQTTLDETPSEAISLESKRQLRELFREGEETSNDGRSKDR